jgi:hypothetical protein
MRLKELLLTVTGTRGYLFLPWFTLLLVWLAYATGIAEWSSTVLPFGLGPIVMNNLGHGMLLLLIGCSALWALEFQRSSGYIGVGLILGTLWLTFFVILFHLGVAIGIVFLGWGLLTLFMTNQH